jgi:hypothetical protein
MPVWVTRLAIAFAVLVASAWPGLGAPALKGPPTDRDADLHGLHALIRKAEDGKPLPDRDEQRALDTIRTLLSRVTQAAEIPVRELPVRIDSLTKSDVTKEFRQTILHKALVVGGEVRGTSASNSIILASEEVQFTTLTNCVVVGKTVRFGGVRNCVIIADEFVRGKDVGGTKGEPDGSVIVSGRWIRLTSATDTVVHVLRPGTEPAPYDPKGLLVTPIRMTTARNVRFLNKSDEVGTTTRTDCKCLESKSPLAK